MKKWFTFFAFILAATAVQAQNGTVVGFVTDVDNNPLVGATIRVEGTSTGTLTGDDGAYRLQLQPGLVTIAANYLGYEGKSAEVSISANETLTINFTLEEAVITGETIVVSGSKRPEKLTESVATIETVFAREIEEYAGVPAELLARQKGVDYFRAGVSGIGINIRGFNSNFNSKNLQVTDGRLSTLVATGLPFGPLNTTIKEDIERYEVILGPNATLYGPNAHNGLLNTITKDPRTSAGTTIALSAGNQSSYRAAIRHAQVINDKLAFKIMGAYSAAEEFDYVDSVYIDRVGAVDSLGNPIPDGVKEGYEEFQLDNTINFLRTEAALYYSVTDDADIIFNWGRSNSNYLSPTNVGRNQIKDWRINYYQLRFTSDHFFVQGYLTESKTDSTYAIDERTKQYYRGIDAGLSEKEAAGGFSYGSGALFQDASRRWNAEAQYNNTFGNLEMIIGAQYQLDQANSLGTYLLDEDAEDYINVGQYGGYLHLNYNFGGGWKATAAGRADYHDVYAFNFVPKFGILKSFGNGAVRLTYGQGIAAPTILNLYGNLFTGLILGNAEGFTLIDGTEIASQSVEKLQTIEAGYRGQVVPNKLFLDVNAYYNISQDFLSPLKVLGVATHRGDTPIEEVQDGYAAYQGLVASYVNFGEFNTYGFDFGATWYISEALSLTANYSYFGYSIDETNLENDFDGSGTVNFLDLLVNAPNHKGGLGLNYSGSKLFGNVYARWVQEYDYFSSFQIASRSYPDLLYRGVPIIEDARSADTYNYGPLGGFVDVALGLGYRINDIFTISGQVTNVLGTEFREFTAAPPTGRLFSLELRVNLPAIKPLN
ncbi:MAG: TonB-dependent receptor [Bacteroidetes bacterium]|nr:TonB-dependent receptor [Bacteroidota bacterium]